MTLAVVVPLKRFDLAKARLRHDEHVDVASVAESLARGVVLNSRPRTVIVVSEHPTITAFAESLGAEALMSHATDLNEAVQHAYEALSERFEWLIIVHGDLRSPEGLGTFEPDGDMTIFADHHLQGTNVIVIPTGLDFHFAYGPGSLQRHIDEARRLNVACRVITDSPWRYDVDEPSDLKDD